MDETTSELTPQECWDLLATRDLGRLAMCLGEMPEIFPVNYVVAHGTVVFRTAPGVKHVSARRDRMVAFEVDSVDHETGTAWSVVVKGRARDMSADTEREFALTLPLRPMHAGSKNLFVRIEPEGVTGRRFPLASAGRWLEDEVHATKD
jgi:nitroimidazol reductase NimA-like FMN-containing flavoprotein (pyridoxamine 5'-phosphate oxidase superfamily)